MPWDGHPEMLVFDEFLWEHVISPHMHPGSTLTLRHPDDHQCHPVVKRSGQCFTGAILKDGQDIYRIGEYTLPTNSWWARWPD